MSDDTQGWRYFVGYTGVKLPLKLISELEGSQLEFRNTFIRARMDDQDRVVLLEKLVHGDIHLTHRYVYDETGKLKRAEIAIEDDETVMEF